MAEGGGEGWLREAEGSLMVGWLNKPPLRRSSGLGHMDHSPLSDSSLSDSPLQQLNKSPPSTTHRLDWLSLDHSACSSSAVLSQSQQRPAQLDQGGRQHRRRREGASRLHSFNQGGDHADKQG